ncbi:phage head-tail connector protein [Candidatus Woesearchaeota archaeon]|nr:phage head-tail connector protein [Candidatus Woesearchaeota archaeon]
MALNAYALTTVARQKEFMGVTVPSYDTILERLINQVTEYIERYCDRRFIQTAYTNEVYDGTGNDKLMLQQYPVSSSASFTLQARQAIENINTWDDIDADLYFVKNDAGIVVLTGGSKFLKYPQHYRVTYTAGYNFNAFANTTFLETVGAGDLEYAVWKLVATVFQRRKIPTGIQSESLGDYSVSFRASTMSDEEVREILESHRRPYGFA